MKELSYKEFVSAISEEKPAMIFFHYLADEKYSLKIQEVLKKIQPKFPLLNIYEYLIDKNEDNQNLADLLEIQQTPVLIFFKNGNFHRYKNKQFTEKSIISFIGNPNLYQPNSELQPQKPKNIN
jgi:hypothetical protein